MTGRAILSAVALFLLTAPFLMPHTGRAGMKGPGDAQDRAMVAEGRPLTEFLAGMIRGYQLYISHLSRNRCRMIPSCSEYARQAVVSYGPLTGSILAAGRLMHELDQKDYSDPMMVNRRLFWKDELRNNVFWWDDKEP